VIENTVIESSIKVKGLKGEASDITLSDPSDPASSFIDVSDSDVLTNYTFTLA
jgi:hypothetical protein